MSLQTKLLKKYGTTGSEPQPNEPEPETYIEPVQLDLAEFNSSPEVTKFTTEVFPSRTQARVAAIPLGVFIRPYACEVSLPDRVDTRHRPAEHDR